MIIVTASNNKSLFSGQSLFDVQSKLVASGVNQALVTDGGGSIALYLNNNGHPITPVEEWRHKSTQSAAQTVTNYIIFNLVP
jgi:exopolysaccharide biosynthesis protein